jgi:hypothetical protein
MAEVNRISSFKSFSEIKSQENEMKLREENSLKKQETLSKIEEILDEMGLTNLSEIDEDSQSAFISKLLGKETNEGNAFVYAAGKAKADGKKEFEFNGKTYKVTIKDTGIKEDNEIIDEAISRSEYDRMDGLHNMKAMKSLIDSAKTIFDDLSEEMFEFDEICDFIVMKIKKSKLAGMYESVNEARINATKALQEIVDGNTSAAEGLKISKELAQHYIDWIRTSPYGKRNATLPLNMLVKASFNWGIERQLDPKLKTELDTLKGSIKESIINEAVAKQFDKDMQTLIKDIKSGYGWIDPEFVSDTWENSSDSIDFELVKGEIYKRLIAANLLAYPNPDDEEKKGVPVRKLQELGIKESVITEGKDDYMAKFGSATINLKKGYKHHTEDELNDLYDKLGDLVKTLNVKDVTLVFEANSEESATNEATVEVDAVDPKDNNLAKLLKKYKVSLEVINKNGPSGYPEVKLTGDVKSLKAVLADDEYGWDDADLAEYIEEAIVTEAEIKSDDEFKEYAMTVLKKAFGSDFEEAKAGDTIDGILKKCDGDYGAAVGMLTSSLGESATNEAFNAKYWEDYHEKSTKITSASKVARAVEDEVEEWNDNNEDGEDNEVTNAGEKKVMNLAHDFFKATGWISSDVIQAMIAQES